jgi:hypothetical protein
MTMWERWCALHGHQPIPASPTMIARFIAELTPLGVERVWQAVLEISRAHYTIGLPDPTVSAPVVIEMNRLSGIKPPRSWPAEEKVRFLTLPYDVQAYLAKREAQRDEEIKKIHREFAKLKKEQTNGIPQTDSVAGTDRNETAAQAAA